MLNRTTNLRECGRVGVMPSMLVINNGVNSEVSSGRTFVMGKVSGGTPGRAASALLF